MDVELSAIREFLLHHHPYDALPSGVLDDLVGRMTSRYYRRNSIILSAGRVTDAVFVVRSGAVDLTTTNGVLVERSDEGATFGVSSARDQQPSRYTMVALEDTLVLVIGADDFRSLLEQEPAFGTFFSDQSAQRLHTAVDNMRAPGTGRDVLRTALREVVSRAPISIDEGRTVQEAAAVMTDVGVSSLLVTRNDRMAGIVTDRDMRRLVVAQGHPVDAPVGTIMTADPITISPDATAVEAVLTMMRHGFHHLPVVEGERPMGMVTSSDIMRLQQANPVAIVAAIGACTSVEDLIAARSRLPGLVRELVHHHAPADEIARIITAVADAVTRSLLGIAESELGPPPTPYAWVALGSQGRLEMGLSSDQDNALVLPEPEGGGGNDPDHEDYFAALAEQVTQGLAAVGYPLCPGDIMASNPRWRLAQGQWRTVFHDWVASPDSDAVLNADTFFDMRPVTGDDLVIRLRAQVQHETAGNPRFLARLAREAVKWQPPLGFFRGFVLDRAGSNAKGLDLKAGGLVAVVQIARIHALAHWLPEVSTMARLSGAAAAGAMSEQRAEDLRDAYELINYLRLQHHVEQAEQGVPADNVIDPDELTTMDQRGLRDAFRIIKQAQTELGYTYRLHAVS